MAKYRSWPVSGYDCDYDSDSDSGSGSRIGRQENGAYSNRNDWSGSDVQREGESCGWAAEQVTVASPGFARTSMWYKDENSDCKWDRSTTMRRESHEGEGVGASIGDGHRHGTIRVAQQDNDNDPIDSKTILYGCLLLCRSSLLLYGWENWPNAESSDQLSDAEEAWISVKDIRDHCAVEADIEGSNIL